MAFCLIFFRFRHRSVHDFVVFVLFFLSLFFRNEHSNQNLNCLKARNSKKLFFFIFQGSAALQCNPFFARDTLVPVPDIFRLDRTEKSSPKKKNQEKSTSTWKKMYEANDIPTRLVLMEEKNVYCGPYNVLLLRDE